MGTIVTLFVFQVRSHVDKVESLINSYETDLENHEYFDMQAGEQVLSLEWYHLLDPDMSYEKYISVDPFLVTESRVKGSKLLNPI